MESKDIIKNYVDACELIKEIDESINNINGSMYAHDIVSGSSPEFPYHRIGIHISGSSPDPRKEKELDLLFRRRQRAYDLKTKAEEEMSMMPARIQRIIRYKIIDGMRWEEVADKMGRGCTGNSIRMELDRYFKKKK